MILTSGFKIKFKLLLMADFNASVAELVDALDLGSSR